MAQYIVKGNRVEVVPDGSLIIKQNLPAGTYFVKYEQSSSYEGFYLESSPNFSTPTSIYGDIMERTDRIVNTYLDRAKRFVNTGVLLSGIKGSGKTFQAKIISNVLREKYNIPTLIVSATYNPTKLALYLKDITDPEEYGIILRITGSAIVLFRITAMKILMTKMKKSLSSKSATILMMRLRLICFRQLWKKQNVRRRILLTLSII